MGAVLTVALLVVALAVVFFRDAEPCLPASSWDCGCHGDTTGRGLSQEYTEHSLTVGERTGSYKVFESGIDPARPVGLLFRLHGDGAYEYDQSPTFLACLAAVAADHNLVMVAPHTPSRDETWWRQLNRNVVWLKELHGEVGRTVASDLGSVDPERTWWMGYSGGAELLTYGLLPQRGELVTAGALMIGGGGAPKSAFPEATVTQQQRDTLPLVWVTGARDDGTDPAADFDALSASRAGAEYYREHGFAGVDTNFSRDADHFTIDQVAVLHETLSAHR